MSAGINHRGFSWDVITSIKRYYSNNFKDENKQHAINLLLGNYRPKKGLLNLWEIDSDYLLHEMSEQYEDKALQSADAQQQDAKIKLVSSKKEQKDVFFEEFYPPIEFVNFEQVWEKVPIVDVVKQAPQQTKDVLRTTEGFLTSLQPHVLDTVSHDSLQFEKLLVQQPVLIQYPQVSQVEQDMYKEYVTF